MDTFSKQHSKINHVKQTLENQLFEMEFARAANNHHDLILTLSEIQAIGLRHKLKTIATIANDISHLIQTPHAQMPIFDETRLDTLVHLLQQAISDI